MLSRVSVITTPLPAVRRQALLCASETRWGNKAAAVVADEPLGSDELRETPEKRNSSQASFAPF